MRRHLAFETVLSLLLLLAACGDAPAEPQAASDPAAAWSGTIAFEAGVKLGGCDVGDLDPSKPGNEIAAVAQDGRVFLVHHDDAGWHGEPIAAVTGEMIQCAIGDADPTREGNELVMVGMAAGTEDSSGKGAVHVVFREADTWKVEKVFEDTALVHGVCVADVDPLNEGNEIVVVGFSRRATILAKVHGSWSMLGDAPLPAPGKAVVAAAGGVFVANTSSDLAFLSSSVPWPEAAGELTLTPMGAAQARLAADEKWVVAACDDGGLRVVRPDGPMLIHKEGAKLRGAAIGDLDPLVPGVEAATAGYGKTMTLLYPQEGTPEWKAVTLWRDTDRFHHLAVGELLAGGLGLEIVAVGYSGRVIVASRTRP